LFVTTGLQVEAKLALLEIELNKAVFKKDTLAKQAKDCEDKLVRAGKLIGGLGGERTRWIANIASIEVDLTHMIGDVIVAGGHIAYTGPFTPPYRLSLNLEWVTLLMTDKVTLLLVVPNLTTEPANHHNTESARTMHGSHQILLCIELQLGNMIIIKLYGN